MYKDGFQPEAGTSTQQQLHMLHPGCLGYGKSTMCYTLRKMIESVNIKERFKNFPFSKEISF